MAIERTFSMIKPDATRRNLTGAITKMLEDAGLRVVASKRVWMSRREAEGFYAVHKERPFFGELVEGMTSGPTIVQVLEGENAILKNREIMGATADDRSLKIFRALLSRHLARPGPEHFHYGDPRGGEPLPFRRRDPRRLC